MLVAMTTAPRGELLHRVREEEETITHQRLVGYHDNGTMRRASKHIKEEEEMERYTSHRQDIFTQ